MTFETKEKERKMNNETVDESNKFEKNIVCSWDTSATADITLAPSQRSLSQPVSRNSKNGNKKRHGNTRNNDKGGVKDKSNRSESSSRIQNKTAATTNVSIASSVVSPRQALMNQMIITAPPQTKQVKKVHFFFSSFFSLTLEATMSESL